jgi:RimJ/RimL family protein N-acetyltransferase
VERQWSRQISGSGLSLAVVEASTGDAAGMIGLFHREQPGVVGVGYWTVTSRRRQGFTQRSLSLLSRWALRVPGIARIEAIIEPNNEGSIRVAEYAGFRREGLLRNYLSIGSARVDALLYSLVQEDIV